MPHDWAITGPFNPSEDGYAGKLPWRRGVGWYRSQIELDCDPSSRVYLDFDGVMAFPKIFINGKLAGDWDYGYTPFRVDVTRFVKMNGTNSLAVRVDTTKHGTRWYPGAGIYRKVTLQIRRPIHIAQWGTWVTTPEVSEKEARVDVQASVENHSEVDAAVGVVCRIRDPDGKQVLRGSRIDLRSRPLAQKHSRFQRNCTIRNVGTSMHLGCIAWKLPSCRRAQWS